MPGLDFTLPTGWGVPLATVAAVFDKTGAAATVDYRDPSSPFRIQATLGEWRTTTGGDGPRPSLAVSIVEGTLHDEDKGACDLAGFEIGISASNAEPSEVLNPGPLSELQQAGLIDAIASHLQSLGLRCVAATLVGFDGRTTVHGVLGSGTSPADRNSFAAFWAPRTACEAAGAIAVLQTRAAARAVARVITSADGHSHAFAVHGLSVDDPVCLIGRLA
jgi:hypothetical protein